MPILPPSTPVISGIGSAFTIGTCVGNLPSKFGNRQNLGVLIPGTTNYTNQNLADGSLAIQAVMEAIKELTETYEFEELKYQTPVPPASTLGFTAGNPIVPVGLILGTIQGNTNYPQYQNQNFCDITDIYTFWMWLSSSTTQAGKSLKYRRVPTIDNYSYGITSNIQNQLGTAPPNFFTRFGNILQVGPVPDQAYPYFVRVKLRHPYPVGGTQTFVPAAMTCVIAGGVVTGNPTLVSGGSGYRASSTIPLVFGASATGVQATGQVTTDANGIVVSTLLGAGGSGYLTAPTVNTAAVQAQQVFMPDTWQEVIEYAACMRLALWEGAEEYVAMFKTILHGDPENPGQPGLIKARIPQMVRDELHNERQLTMKVARYTHA